MGAVPSTENWLLSVTCWYPALASHHMPESAERLGRQIWWPCLGIPSEPQGWAHLHMSLSSVGTSSPDSVSRVAKPPRA